MSTLKKSLTSTIKADGINNDNNSEIGYDINNHDENKNTINNVTDQTAIINKIRSEQQSGPPPNIKKRQLIFDSLQKIISRNFGKSNSRQSVLGETRGTYIFTWGAGYHGQLGRNFERGMFYSTYLYVMYCGFMLLICNY